MDIADVVFGCIIGVLAGVLPGIHSNTFAAILLALNPENVQKLIISSAIAYTIADIIPTTLLGIPDEETAVGILPSHRMVLEGRGFEAISISVFSSFLSLILCIPLIFTVLIAEGIYNLTPIVLIVVSAFLILSEGGSEFEGSLSTWRRRLYALLIFLSSGFLGYIALENSYLAELNTTSSVFIPLLTGLFASPVLLQASNKNIPKQKLKISFPDMKAVISGSVAGFFVSLFPGISSGIATTVAVMNTRKAEDFISAMSSANTANALLCFAVLIYFKRIRSGAADALLKVDYIPSLSELVVVSLICGFLALIFTLMIAFILLSKMHMVNTRVLSIAVFAFLIFLVLYSTGFFGLAVFFSAIPIGLACSMFGVKRINCMGCLIIPILLRF